VETSPVYSHHYPGIGQEEIRLLKGLDILISGRWSIMEQIYNIRLGTHLEFAMFALMGVWLDT
jgi:hypothetical protein